MSGRGLLLRSGKAEPDLLVKHGAMQTYARLNHRSP